MMSIIAAVQWLIANWQLIATVFSSASSLALFFMHGNNKATLQELRDFIDSLQISQSKPIDTGSAKVEAAISNPKK